MKLSRNDPCFCGSGKKYKKCHLNNKSNVNPDKHYFDLKGKAAEEVVQYLAEKTFLTDWCYKNPFFQKGKEICDLLIVFGDKAIIWQIKDLKLNIEGKYKQSDVDRNLRQLIGAYKTLFKQQKAIELSNPRRGKEMFNPKSIKEIFLISALVGKGEEYYAPVEEINKLFIHVFDREFTQVVLNELDTIGDFIHYLRTKESLIKTGKEITILGGEKELLAFYLMNNRTFDRFKESTMIVIEEGAWKHLQQKNEFKEKKQIDKISYLWDKMINGAHEAGVSEYEKIAREMAQLNRFERRSISKGFVEAQILAHNDGEHNNYRRIIVGEGTTYCFLFMDDPEPREKRKSILLTMCFIARGKYPKNTKVLGIATEMKIRPQVSFDFCLLDKPSWSEKDKNKMKKLQEYTGIFTKTKMNVVHENEYPELKNNS